MYCDYYAIADYDEDIHDPRRDYIEVSTYPDGDVKRVRKADVPQYMMYGSVGKLSPDDYKAFKSKHARHEDVTKFYYRDTTDQMIEMPLEVQEKLTHDQKVIYVNNIVISSEAGKHNKQVSKPFPKDSQIRASFLNDWEIIETVGDGNCGPDAIRRALNIAGKTTSVEDIRSMIADAITDENVDFHIRELLKDPSKAVKKYANIAEKIKDTNKKVDATQKIVKLKSYFITTEDLTTISRELDKLIIALNADYKPNIDFGGENILIYCNPQNATERTFYQKIENNEDFDVILLLYHGGERRHYELIFDAKNKRAIVPYSQLPKPVQENLTQTCVSRMKDMILIERQKAEKETNAARANASEE